MAFQALCINWLIRRKMVYKEDMCLLQKLLWLAFREKNENLIPLGAFY
jgi:hypothetical protein